VDSLAQKVHLRLFRKCNNLCSVIEEKLQIHGNDGMFLVFILFLSFIILTVGSSSSGKVHTSDGSQH
jgi:hypothetical protein